ncbi:MAG: hypothetical protein WCI64_09125 [Chlorobium sp.]
MPLLHWLTRDTEYSCSTKDTIPVPSQPHIISKQSEEFQWDETIVWLEKINKNMQRMSTDEKYRLEIAKDLS